MKRSEWRTEPYTGCSRYIIWLKDVEEYGSPLSYGNLSALSPKKSDKDKNILFQQKMQGLNWQWLDSLWDRAGISLAIGEVRSPWSIGVSTCLWSPWPTNAKFVAKLLNSHLLHNYIYSIIIIVRLVQQWIHHWFNSSIMYNCIMDPKKFLDCPSWNIEVSETSTVPSLWFQVCKAAFRCFDKAIVEIVAVKIQTVGKQKKRTKTCGCVSLACVFDFLGISISTDQAGTLSNQIGLLANCILRMFTNKNGDGHLNSWIPGYLCVCPAASSCIGDVVLACMKRVWCMFCCPSMEYMPEQQQPPPPQPPPPQQQQRRQRPRPRPRQGTTRNNKEQQQQQQWWYWFSWPRLYSRSISELQSLHH